MIGVVFGLAARGAEAPDPESLTGLSLEELLELEVVTVSRRAERIDAAPNTVYVVTSEEIERRGYHTLRQLLRTIPGFAVFHKDLEFVAQVRGVAPNDNQKIAFLVDGVNVAQGFEAAMLNGPIDLAIAERVEVIVGPGTVLYGADSILATVNVITKAASPREVSAAVGNVMVEGTAVLGRHDAADRYVAGTLTFMQQRGWDAWPTPEDHGGPGQPDLTDTTVTGQIDPSWFLTAAARLGDWSVHATSRNLRFPDLKHAVSTPAGVDGERYERFSTMVLRHQRAWTPTLSSVIDAGYADKRQIRVFTGSAHELQGESSYDLALGTWRLDGAVTHQTARNVLQVGLLGRLDQNRSNYVFSWAPQDPTVPPGEWNQIDQLVDDVDTYAVGAFVSDAWAVTDWLVLTGAARADANSSIGIRRTFVNPRAAAVVSLDDVWTTKLVYNSATRIPSAWEGPLNQVWGAGAPGAPDYASVNPLARDPEVLSAVEWQNILYLGSTRLSATAYLQHLEGFIAWGGPFTNIGDLDGKGVELAVQSAPTPSLQLWGNAALSQATFELTVTDSSFGNVPTNDLGEMSAAPALTANVGVDWAFAGRFAASGAVRYFTHQPTWSWQTDRWFYTNHRAYLDLSLTATDLGLEGLDVALQGFNLLHDRRTVAAQYLLGEYRERGIEVLGEVTYRF